MKIGILGGGQLGRMMIPVIRQFGWTSVVLDPNENAPCKNSADFFVKGDFRDFETVVAFGQTVDVLTIEIEQVNVDALESLEKQGKTVRPSSTIIRMIQDKLVQKEFLRDNGIPTSEFFAIKDKSELRDHLDFFPAAQKARTGGYDGNGVKIIKNSAACPPQAWEISDGIDAPSILEKLVDIDQELSVIVARNHHGQIETFPVVGQEFDPEANLVKFTFAPAEITPDVEKKCKTIATEIAEKIQLEGLLAVEFFLDTSGNILVNEMAPRAHNSGHWTMDGAITSQFEQLIRAIAGVRLGNTNITRPTVMVNLLGAENQTGTAIIKNSAEIFSTPEAHLHWYGKTETRPMRKMGHINVGGETIKDAKAKAENLYESVSVIAE